jgi:hypothetical protein
VFVIVMFVIEAAFSGHAHQSQHDVGTESQQHELA